MSVIGFFDRIDRGLTGVKREYGAALHSVVLEERF